MKKTTLFKMTIVAILAITILVTSGCATQTGGGKYEIAGWDHNGPFLGRFQTNGMQTAAGKKETLVPLNENFNQTMSHTANCRLEEKKVDEKSAIAKKAIGKGVIKDANDLGTTLEKLGF